MFLTESLVLHTLSVIVCIGSCTAPSPNSRNRKRCRLSRLTNCTFAGAWVPGTRFCLCMAWKPTNSSTNVARPVAVGHLGELGGGVGALRGPRQEDFPHCRSVLADQAEEVAAEQRHPHSAQEGGQGATRAGRGQPANTRPVLQRTGNVHCAKYWSSNITRWGDIEKSTLRFCAH